MFQRKMIRVYSSLFWRSWLGWKISTNETINGMKINEKTLPSTTAQSEWGPYEDQGELNYFTMMGLGLEASISTTVFSSVRQRKSQIKERTTGWGGQYSTFDRLAWPNQILSQAIAWIWPCNPHYNNLLSSGAQFLGENGHKLTSKTERILICYGDVTCLEKNQISEFSKDTSVYGWS